MGKKKYRVYYKNQMHQVTKIEGNKVYLESGVIVNKSETTLMKSKNEYDSYGTEIYESDYLYHNFMVDNGNGDVGEDSEEVLIEDELPFFSASVGCLVVGNKYEK